MRDLRRIAIVNRGEAAMRLIHAVREYQREQGASIATIAIFTEPDARSPFVREADRSYCIGPALVPGAGGDGRRQSAYLDHHRLEEALVVTGADAAWVGWGFVAEQPAFAELCRRTGVLFIGPSPEAMLRLGDKITAKRLAEEAGVPVAPWSGGAVESVEALREQAARLGYPLMLKASGGGGGRGIRALLDGDDLAEAFTAARREAAAAFGDPTVFVERRLIGAHHVEVQVAADEHGGVWALGVRDCTLQRRHQKVIEEAPSPVLLPDEERALLGSSASLVARAGYTGVGTVEYLWDNASRRAAFMEVNTRLQVEHPVTECTTGVDLVKLQLHLARGGRLEEHPPPTRGHAIEARLCAEDPDRHFAPAPGVIELLRIASGPGVRIDSGVAEGDRIAPEFDSMIAKIIACGATRDEALARLHRALSATAVVVRGGTTNRAFLLSVLDRPEVREGRVDTTLLDRLTSGTGRHPAPAHADVALLHGAIEEYEVALRGEIERFLASAERGRPSTSHEPPRPAELVYRHDRYRFEVRRIGPRDYRVTPEGERAIDVRVEPTGRFERRLRCGGHSHRVTLVTHAGNHLVEVDGVPHHVGRDPGGVVVAPIPAVVVSFACRLGDRVERGQRLVTLEAMKMEVPVTAPLGGVVRAMPVSPNAQVAVGAVLLEIEPEGTDEERPDSERVGFGAVGPTASAPATSVRERFQAACADLRRLLLGFDVTPAESQQLAARWAELCRGSHTNAEMRAAEDELIEIFTDVHRLFRRLRPGEGDDTDAPRSAAEYLTHYLRVRDVRAAGLPGSFIARLERALRWYGLGVEQAAGDDGYLLAESLLRIHRSHERVGEQIAPLTSILERRLAEPWHRGEAPDGGLQGEGGEAWRRLLERLVGVSKVRFPQLADLASEVRHAHSTRPLFGRVRVEDYRRLDEGIEELRRAVGPGRELLGDERAALVEPLVDCPQPLAGPLSQRAARADAEETAILLELLTRRFYRIRALEGFAVFEADGQLFARGDYTHEGRHNRIYSAFSSFAALSVVLARLAPAISDLPGDREVVVDLYVWDGSPSPDGDATAALLREMLDRAPLDRRLRRVSVTLAATEGAWGLAREQNFTFRPEEAAEAGDGGAGYREERALRGIHPMMAKRLHIWQLSHFALERLPSVQDVYLYRGVAIGNPRDERLFAVAEVRDVTPVRDPNGHVVELPHLERMLIEACAAIRLARARHAERLEWNRVLLYVWPELTLSGAELGALARRMAPVTEGLGLEVVLVRARFSSDGERAHVRDTLLRLGPGEGGVSITLEEPTEEALRPLSPYQLKVAQLKRRGLHYPYELAGALAPPEGRDGVPRGQFIEHDLDESGRLVPVERPPGGNTAHLVAGVIRSFTERYPDGMTRVILLGDPSREMGSLAEPECRRVCAAIDLAEELRVPLEWFALSAGAKISMQSGTENMDWVARALRRIVQFTQAGGEINVVVCGINVGAQPYWNAEATMLMHTRGILVMTPEGAMVLTGKQALDYSGSVSADDNIGIGGYERIMGVNGQAQYFARDLTDASRLLLRHYEYTYVAPGERWPRPFVTRDPRDRDPCVAPHPECGFSTVGEIFSEEHNPGRKRPFEIRRVMAAVADFDHPTLERWFHWRGADMTGVWDAFLGGHAISLLGVGSRPIERLGFVPADGPDRWTAGALFPQSSKKMARAINAASGNRPLVVLANLSGFDGSPESMRKWQLEYGAEIGRAVVNFKGPIVFCVVSRYHGGAFVVFSRALNAHLEASALEGSHASVIGGAPAAAVVFSREVETRAAGDARVRELEEAIRRAGEADKARVRAELQARTVAARAAHLGRVAEEFDAIHDIHRALRVGSLDRVIAPRDLRAYLIDAVERGVARASEAGA